jgi:co-chaperonin GroES (HSP10)
MKIKATYNRVIVKEFYDEKIGKSMIIVPDYQHVKKIQSNYYGLVISVGPENTLGIKPGDKILFDRMEGKPISFNGEKLISLESDYISAVLKEHQ